MNSKYVLGIDTSNYKTSVAVIDNEFNIVYDTRKYLNVKRGERGLRQSEALFQHVNMLPELIEGIPVDLAENLDAVAWSSRPRPVQGSYMPVFNAGANLGRSIAAINGIQGIGFSHQEGHIEAVLHDTHMAGDKPFIACHFSGGTTEILKVKPRIHNVVLNTGIFYNIDMIGGTKDIAFGQVIDRAGVAMGIDFPSGEEIDRLALSADHSTDYLTDIKTCNGYMNLSGIDTQIKRILMAEQMDSQRAEFAREILQKITDSIERAISQVMKLEEIDRIVMAGGVSSSSYIRNHIAKSERLAGSGIYFGSPDLSQDNAVGIAVLGGRYIWD